MHYHWISALFGIFTVILIINRTLSVPDVVVIKDPLFTPDLSVELMQNWTRLANETFDPSREERVLRMLQKNAGIYHSKIKAKKIGFEMTVLVSVVSLSTAEKKDKFYDLLRNWLCYTAHYDFMPVVYYLLPPDNGAGHFNSADTVDPGLQSFFEEMRGINENIIFIEYPIHLFWSLLSKKTKWEHEKGRAMADFKGTYPTFFNHGALTMLVPILEVLTLGYSAVYLDIDVALVKDPLPFISLGNSDLVVSEEFRQCRYHAPLNAPLKNRKDFLNWQKQKKLEPNTGVMMVRSTHEGKRMMNSFLSKLVEENRNNDQAFLNHHLGQVQYSNDCQYNYTQSYDENIRRNNTDQQIKSQSSQNSSMCYLTDVLFQNGYLLYHCAAHKRAKTEYMIRMHEYALVGSPIGTTTDTISRNSIGIISERGYENSGVENIVDNRENGRYQGDRHSKNSSNQLLDYSSEINFGNDEHFIAPVIAHPNYCGNKKKCLDERGLWLVETYSVEEKDAKSGVNKNTVKHRCTPYNIIDTIYGRPKWMFDVGEEAASYKSTNAPVITVRHPKTRIRNGVKNSTYSTYSTSSTSSNKTAMEDHWGRITEVSTVSELKINRTKQIILNIQASRGVYSDKKKSNFYGLENTVLISILSYDEIMSVESPVSDDIPQLRGHNGTFARILKHFLLDTEKYGLRPLLYITPPVNLSPVDSITLHTNVNRVLTSLIGLTSEQKSPNVHFTVAYSYPNALIFSFLRDLPNWKHDHINSVSKCSFAGDQISPARFGIMMTLVPILEIISLGYGVLFIDVSVRLLRDPIPYLFATTTQQSDSAMSLNYSIPDISFCKERSPQKDPCDIREYSLRPPLPPTSTPEPGPGPINTDNKVSAESNNPNIHMTQDVVPVLEASAEWVVKPNFSIMRLIPSQKSILMLTRWVRNIVSTGDRQGIVSFKNFDFAQTHNCNSAVPVTYDPSSPIIGERNKISAEDFPNITYCFYNSLQFQSYHTLHSCQLKYNTTERQRLQRIKPSQLISITTNAQSAMYGNVTEWTAKKRKISYEVISILTLPDVSTASHFDHQSTVNYIQRLQ